MHQLTEGIDYFLHKTLVDVFSIPLSLDEFQDGTSQFVVLGLDVTEEILLPLYKCKLLEIYK